MNSTVHSWGLKNIWSDNAYYYCADIFMSGKKTRIFEVQEEGFRTIKVIRGSIRITWKSNKAIFLDIKEQFVSFSSGKLVIECDKEGAEFILVGSVKENDLMQWEKRQHK